MSYQVQKSHAIKNCAGHIMECGIELPPEYWTHAHFGDNVDRVEVPLCDRCSFAQKLFGIATSENRFREGYDHTAFQARVNELLAKTGIADITVESVDPQDELSIKELTNVLWRDRPLFH